LRIFANSCARDRLSACDSGSPAAFISHLDRSSCTCRRIVTCDNDDGELAPEIRMAPRPSRCSFNSTLFEPSRDFSGNNPHKEAVPFNIGESFSFDQRLALSSVG
jgi:hypothetical protein